MVGNTPPNRRFTASNEDKVSCYRMRCLFKSTRSGQGELLQDFFGGNTMLGGCFLPCFIYGSDIASCTSSPYPIDPYKSSIPAESGDTMRLLAPTRAFADLFRTTSVSSAPLRAIIDPKLICKERLLGSKNGFISPPSAIALLRMASFSIPKNI